MAFINEKINVKNVTDIVSSSFLNYSMSVIASRALPDVRDGMKPVHRRIMYGMHELGNTPDKAYKKSARIVGDVMGKFHPHGDSSIYEALVRLSQPWSVRNTLVDMHGNNGSKDGDGAAAMRYTESRMEKLATELLRDIGKDTINFKPNYDGAEQEPCVLPAAYPNLLVNGSEGIAVGMATKIPPHNLGEVIDGVVAKLENDDISTEELMDYIKGPDFPTGGEIYGIDGIRNAYETGRGKITIRAKIDVEVKKGKSKLIIRELPYQVSPLLVMEKIEKLQDSYNEYILEKKKGKNIKESELIDFLSFDGVSNLTDRSNDYDVTIEILLKKDVNPDIVKEYLYKNTALETSYSINNLALVPVIDRDGIERLQPKVLSLNSILEEYIKHRTSVVKRRLTFEIKKLNERCHKLKGIIVALNQLDLVIKIIRNSKERSTASTELMNTLGIDSIQAMAILDMRLSHLTNLDQERQRSELEEFLLEIASLEEILNSEELVRKEIKDDLLRVKKEHSNHRRSEIIGDLSDFDKENFISDDEMVITITQLGLIKRTSESTYRTQRRKGIGVNGMQTIEEDFISQLHVARNKDHLLFFTNTGKTYRKRVYDIPQGNANSKGQHIRAVLNLSDDEKIAAILSIREFSDEQFLLFTTKLGRVKKTALSAYSKIHKGGILATKFRDNDELVGVHMTSGNKDITLISKNGISISFKEEEIPVQGRNSSGVKGITLNAAENDEIVASAVHEEGSDLLVATNEGFGKRTLLTDHRIQARGGKGVRCIKLTAKNGKVIDAIVVQNGENCMLMTRNGTIMKLRVKDISQVARNSQGNKIINLRGNDELNFIARIPEEDEEEILEEENNNNN